MSVFPITTTSNIPLQFFEPYTPPQPGDEISLRFKAEGVVLQFITYYSAPEPGANITLRFGVTDDSDNVVSVPSELRIVNSEHEITEFVDIVFDNAELQIDSNESITDVLLEFDSDPSEIKTSAPGHTLTQLEEIEPALSEIVITGTVHSVEHLPEVLPGGTEIKITANSILVGGGQANDLPTGISTGGLGFKWTKAQNYVSQKFKQPWEESTDIKIVEEIPWEPPEDKSKQTKSKFVAKMSFEDQSGDTPWAQFAHKPDKHTKSPHIGIMDFIDEFDKALWETFILRDKKATNPYANTQGINGDFKDIHKRKRWDKPQEYTHQRRNDFGNNRPGSAVNKHHGTYWGPFWYSLWCQEQYFPYASDEDVQLVLKTDVPILNNPDFVQPNNPRCPFDYWYTGGRDNYKPIVVPVLYAERKKVYYMLNSAFIKRISDSADIHFQSVSMSIDRDSWTWDFSITLMSRAALELVWPVDDTLIDIEININGWKWTCRVENWSEDVSFGQKSWTVSGRSPSVELGEPYLVESSFSNDEEHGGQIVDSILENTGWSASWSHDDFNPHLDWLVPASTLNLYDSSKIQQMQSIVQAVGAFIQTAPDTNSSQDFVIHPTYMRNPWNWGTQITPTVYLNDAICYEYGRSNNIIKPVNSIIVSGENAGVVVDATKDGTAGDNPAAMIIDSLMTSQEAATERARHEIGKTGFWINHSMRLFSLMPPGEAPGLMLPGTFINMSETGLSAWIGQVTGTQISAAWEDGLKVSQQIEVEQFYG